MYMHKPAAYYSVLYSCKFSTLGSRKLPVPGTCTKFSLNVHIPYFGVLNLVQLYVWVCVLEQGRDLTRVHVFEYKYGCTVPEYLSIDLDRDPEVQLYGRTCIHTKFSTSRYLLRVPFLL